MDPKFPKLDPAGAAFWDVRYRESFTPWDAGQVPRQLRELIASTPAPGRVLVPGCGSGHDVRAFCEAGWDVDGIDFSAAALEAAQPVLGPCASKARLADFFGESVAGPYALVYERAFLCALPRSLWRLWAARVGEIVPRGGFLTGYFYVEPGKERGPPFPLASRDELQDLIGHAFVRVEDSDVPDSIDVFAGKERWQAWQRN
ncbi:Thiopurine S-methyltransferase [Usitatibacter rugosus]|uniref:Thiopurine S-methyltransferase n=1 Tax=Usitatibacter rugosus TaxID=2732067 RepID=A0A6M4GZC7_9PROT|nr:methyltransferase domain-containing protein [Usitatibacter rugosus]QJR10887.1 Thiopurine S-methyltransferase [Usitatibacter rugosus]